MGSPEGFYVVFGPEYEQAARELYAQTQRNIEAGNAQGIWMIVGGPRVTDLKLPLAEMRKCQLHFEHHLAGRRGQQVSPGEFNEWGARLLRPADTRTFGQPKLDMIGDASSAHLTIVLTWNAPVTRQVVLEAARLIEGRFVTNGGKYKPARKWWQFWK